MPPMTGRVIAGRYNLQHPIGRGAMGVVWRARDQILDRDVAVKEVVISSSLSEEERRNAYQRTKREARTAARLSHRGLVAVYDVVEEDGRPWIVMELVPSRSLDQVLTVEGRLPALRVARIGQQLLSALAAAHLAGVLHRDVKPSNVLIATERTGTGWDERAVLTDFGIAQFEGDPRLTQTGMVMGSPGFTAPERIRGGDATHASDLWSLGATLYAAVEGRGPYEQRGGAITTMSAIINEDAPVAAHAGRLAQVIAALMRRDPAARPAAPTVARMFAQVLSVLAAEEKSSSAAAHPPTMISAQAPPPALPVAVRPAEPAADAAADTPASEPSPKPVAAVAMATIVEVPAPVVALPSAAAAEEAVARPAEASAEPSVADAPSSTEETELAPNSAASEPKDGSPEAEAPQAPAADAEADATVEEASTPTPLAQPDAGAAADADADVAGSVAEAVSAVEAMSAVEAPKTSDSDEDTGVPVATGELADASEPAEVGADQSDAANTVIDHGAAGHRPTERSTPEALTEAPKPKPAPSFTAAKPGERSPAPTFSAARPSTPKAAPTTRPATPAKPATPAAPPPTAPPAGYGPAQSQYGAVQYGASSYAANAYGGAGLQQPPMTTPYPDQSSQYTPGTGGGQARRRMRRGWRITLVIIAVLVAVAIGAGVALALGHHGPGTAAGKNPTPPAHFDSVDALNNPSSVVPAGWVTRTLKPSADHTTAGFTIDMPRGWTEQPVGDATYFYGPSHMFLDIDLTRHKYPDDMVQEAKNIEKGALEAGKFPLYKLAYLQAVTVRGTKGAIWQFTWLLDGVRLRADDILFVMPTPAGAQSYGVYIRGPNSGWSAKYLPIFDEILRTFQTVPASA